jgi:hypothetical protein
VQSGGHRGRQGKTPRRIFRRNQPRDIGHSTGGIATAQWSVAADCMADSYAKQEQPGARKSQHFMAMKSFCQTHETNTPFSCRQLLSSPIQSPYHDFQQRVNVRH